MRRRDFIKIVGSALATPPLAARAQQPAMPVIGFLSSSTQAFDEKLRLPPFREGLKEGGYVEGRNVAIEYRGAEQHLDRLPELAADLVRRQVAVITAAAGPQPALAAKATSTTVPIVFNITGDPIKLGLVASFNRPGGNLTGVALVSSTVVAKQFEALHEMIPTAVVIGCLVNPDNPNTETQTKEAQIAARTLGRTVEILHASNQTEIARAFASVVQRHVGALVVAPDGFFNSQPELLAALAAQHSIPAIYSLNEFARVGGLMSYGFSLTDSYRQVGAYTGRILKGDKPADLPVMQATKVELVINVKTAKTLGINFPLSLLGRADEVIE
jgi:putative tryptophan/tyrosine transport system substrate-binding protein